ncbi:hypothetical protein [Helicobacter pylori]|uniref:hypothetical protein n=1 Tax=Helicobacter pylori TaxID=210 RepID=UPI001F396D1B|nr:hypothetical protein [Helicobacter pylori]
MNLKNTFGCFDNQNKKACEKRAIISHNALLWGYGEFLGVVGEFQNTPYPLMSFKNPIF